MLNIAKQCHRVTDKTMAGVKPTIGGNAEISGTRPARIGTMGSLVNLLDRSGEIREGISLSAQRTSLKFLSAIAHLRDNLVAIVPGHLFPTGRRMQHGGEAHAMEAQA